MAMYRNDQDLSELEQAFEIEMEESLGSEEFEDEPAEEFEEEFEQFEDENGSDYADRFYEISQQEFESELELDDAINGPLRQMDEEFFIGGLRKKWKQLKRGGLGGLVKKGFKFAAGRIPAVQALKNATAAARAALRGNLGGLVKAGLGAALKAHPAGAALSPALSALGFEAGEDNREAWDNVVEVGREAYDHLTSHLHENADDPMEASRMANEAFQSALKSARPAAAPGRGSRGKPTRVIRVGRGERVKIIIEGV